MAGEQGNAPLHNPRPGRPAFSPVPGRRIFWRSQRHDLVYPEPGRSRAAPQSAKRGKRSLSDLDEAAATQSGKGVDTWTWQIEPLASQIARKIKQHNYYWVVIIFIEYFNACLTLYK